METWVPVVGFDTKYEVSSHGRVRGIRRRGCPGRVLSPYIHDGYHYAKLWAANKEHRLRIHRLMLLSFVGEPPVGSPHALHADDDKSNNTLENLRWGNDKDNTQDRIANGLHNSARKTECKRGHPFTPENTYLRPDGKGRQCRTCNVAYRERTAGVRHL